MSAPHAAPPPVDPAALQQAQALLRKPTWDEVLSRLHDDKLRSYTIDIETDSTIASDEVADQQSVTQFIQSISQFVTAWEPILAQTPELAPLAFALLKAAAARFDLGRKLETTIDEACDSLLQKLSQPKGPPPQDPRVAAAQAAASASIQASKDKIQIEREESEAKIQREHAEAAANFQLRASQAQADQQLEAAKAGADAERAAIEARTPNIEPR